MARARAPVATARSPVAAARDRVGTAIGAGRGGRLRRPGCRRNWNRPGSPPPTRKRKSSDCPMHWPKRRPTPRNGISPPGRPWPWSTRKSRNSNSGSPNAINNWRTLKPSPPMTPRRQAQFEHDLQQLRTQHASEIARLHAEQKQCLQQLRTQHDLELQELQTQPAARPGRPVTTTTKTCNNAMRWRSRTSANCGPRKSGWPNNWPPPRRPRRPVRSG